MENNNELKITLAIDPASLKDFEKKIQDSVGNIKGGVGNNNFAKSQKNQELEKIKIEKELYKLAIIKRKEEERQVKIQEKQTKLMEKTNKELTGFSKLLSKMGFKGSFGGEIVRGAARELGYGMVNMVGDTLNKVSGGYLSGGGLMSGATTGALIGSAIPVIGTVIGGAIGALIGGVGIPLFEKLMEPVANRMTQLRDLLEVQYARGNVENQVGAVQQIYSRESQKNIINLASGGKMNQNELGKFVTALQSTGFDPVAFHAQALKLSKTKDSEYYGMGVSDIMDRLLTSLSSNLYTREERYANYEKIQNSEGVKNILSAVKDPNLLFRAIDKGTIEKDLNYYKGQMINEVKTNEAIDKVTEDNVTTPLDIIKAQSEFVIKNVELVINYENALVASQNKTLESTKELADTLNMLTISMDGAKSSVGKVVDTVSNTKSDSSFFDDALDYVKKKLNNPFN